MEVTTDVVKLGKSNCLIVNNGPDSVWVGPLADDQEDWFEIADGTSVAVNYEFNAEQGVVSDGVSDVGILYGGTGIFPPPVEGVDVSGFETITDHDSDIAALTAIFQQLDADLTNIAGLATTSYGRNLLTLANAAAADWVTKALYDANTILVANSDDTPLALTVAASTVLGRKASGNIAAMTAAEAAAVLGTNIYGQVQTANPQTGTSYTLVAADAGKLVTLSNAAAITLTLPQDSDATIAVLTYIDLLQLGAGQVTVVAGSGATLRTSGLTAKCRAQYSRVGVQKISTNTWSLFGDLAAS